MNDSRYKLLGNRRMVNEIVENFKLIILSILDGWIIKIKSIG